METTAISLSETGKKAYQAGEFQKATRLFREAAQAYKAEEKPLDAAEAENNISVALLQLDKAKEAYEAALGTDAIFEDSGDTLRQAMALGNQAAALDAMKKPAEALELYEKAATLFSEIGEGDYQETVLKSIAAIKLREGKLQETAFNMLDSLHAAKKPTLFQRILKFILRIIR